jgi:hypothetical protein
MRISVNSFGKAALVGITLAIPLAGCGQVLGIEDWQQGSGGQGGEGGSASTSTGTSTGTQAQVQASAASATSGTGGVGQGGQDPGCDGTCTPEVPAGWLGPVAVTVGDKIAPLPACGPEWSSQTDWQTGTLTAPDAQCGTCNCSSPSGGYCALTQVNISIHTESACNTSSSATTPVTTPNACTQVGLGTALGNTVFGMLHGQSLPTMGSSCVPSGGGATKPPAYFDKQARICEGLPALTDCANGTLCAPKLPPDFRLCIYQPAPDGANLVCPGGYDQLPFFYADIADTRGCTTCQCGVPFNQTCPLSVSYYGAAGCSTTPASTQPPNVCASLGTPQSVYAKVNTGAPSGGSCVPSTLNPTGEVWGTERTLVCCLP